MAQVQEDVPVGTTEEVVEIDLKEQEKDAAMRVRCYFISLNLLNLHHSLSTVL